MIRIAVDAMGGDYAPAEIVKGAVMAARAGGIRIILVGQLDPVQAELKKHDTSGLQIECVRADDIIIEGEHPALALRKKPNASIVVATGLVKAGKADAVVSAGNTGACAASALYLLGLAEGVERPMVGGPLLGLAPRTVLLDAGANIDCRPHHLLNFAIAGTVYAQKMLGVAEPTVAVLSVGAEKGKGNELAREAYTLLEQSGLKFIGNVEGHDIAEGKANVIVCDGFVGNILVKFSEGIGSGLSRWLQSRLQGQLPTPAVDALCSDLLALTSVAEVIGGGPLWGVKGVSCVMHGRGRAEQVAGCIAQAKKAVETGLVTALNAELARAGHNTSP